MKVRPSYPARTACSLAASLLLLSLTAPAQADVDADQTTAASKSSTASGTENTPAKAEQAQELARIVVTATKRAQFVEKVPMSLSAMNQEQLEKQGAANIMDIGRMTPGLSVTTADSYGQPNLAIRGISSQSGAATTAIYVDDAPIQARSLQAALGGTAFPELFDLDHVEVLRGPQGTLFGSSSEGGAIRFITPMPKSAKTSGEVRVGVGMTQGGAPSENAGVAVGGSLSGDTDLLYRVSASKSHDGGYIDRLDRTTGQEIDKNTNSRDASVLRGVLQWKPTSSLTITPSLLLQETKDADRNLYYKEAGLFKTYNMIRQPSHDRFSLSSVSVDYEGEGVNLKSVTSFYERQQHRIDDVSYTNGAIYLSTEVVPGLEDYVAANNTTTTQRNISQEFRISSNDDASSPSSWVAGVFFSRALLTARQAIVEDLDRWSTTVFGVPAAEMTDIFATGPLGPYSYLENDRLKDTSAAVFGEYTYKLGAKTTASLGLRLGVNEYNFSSLQQGAFAANGETLVQGKHRDNSVLPKISISHELSADDMAYATISSGDRPGGGNPDLGANSSCSQDMQNLGIKNVASTYKSDKLWSYEIGYKGRALDRSLDYGVSLYYVDWRNIQTRVTLPICQFAYIANAGGARSLGADLQLQWRATRNLTLSASAAVTDAKYKETIYASGTSTDLDGSAPIVKKGQHMALPKTTATLAAEYGWQLSGGDRAYVRTDYQYASGYKRNGDADTFGYDAAVADAASTHFVTLNTGLTSGAYEWTLGVQNLLNSHTELLTFHYSSNDPSLQATTFRPRTVQLNLRYKF